MVLLFDPVFVTMSMTGSSFVRRRGEELDTAACPRMLMEVLPTLPFTLISTISTLEPDTAVDPAGVGADPHATSDAAINPTTAQHAARSRRMPSRWGGSQRDPHGCVVASSLT